MLKKIVVIGPESTGKSTLSSQLAHHYNTVWVPEYAREYIDSLDRPYQEKDLLKIARGQIDLEEKLSIQANKYLICDTNLLVLQVWSQHKYQRTHSWILDQIAKRHYDFYLLTYIDIPWQDDPQREHPHLREHFFQVYQSLLERLAKPYIIIKGDHQNRLETAINVIDNLG